MSDRPDSGAATEQEPRSGAPPDASSDDDEFWRLAKKGLVAWGHEPSLDEITDYWRTLVDDQHRSAHDLIDPTVDPIAHLAALTALARSAARRPAVVLTASPASVEDRMAVLSTLAALARTAVRPPAVALAAPVEQVASESLVEDDEAAVAVDEAVAMLAALVGLGRGGADPALRFGPPAPDGAVDDAVLAPVAAAVNGDRSVVTAEAVGWLAVPVTAIPPPLVGPRHRTWWRVAAARPAPPPEPASPAAPSPSALASVPVELDAAVAPTEPDPVVVRPADVPGQQSVADVRGELEPASVSGELGPAVVPGDRGRGAVQGEVAGEVGLAGVLGLAGGGLALADCLGWIDRLRRAQQGRRGWGRHIALPVAPLDAYERELRHGADAAGAAHLETALRAAAAGAGTKGLPPVRWVEAGADEVVVALDDVGIAPPGFVEVTGRPGSWATAQPGSRELAAAADRALAPLPLLAPLGRTATGRERLVDLEARGVTTVDGPADDVLGLLRAVVVAMATAAWCTPLRIVVVGLERELAGFPGVEAVDSLDVALTYAEAHVHQVASALVAVGETSLGRVRALELSSAAAGALLVVSARPPDDPVVGGRVAALAAQRSSGVGVLLRHPPSPEVDLAGACARLCIGPEGSLADDGAGDGGGDGDAAGRRVGARRLDPVDVRRLLGLVTVAGGRGEGEPALRPRRSHDGEEPADVVVRVMGDVAVAGADDREAEAGAVEVLAYLALREASVTHATLEAALFPDGAPAAHAVDRTVTAAVELVGPGTVRRPTPGRFAVSERVATDYGLLCDLVAEADDAVAADDLATAADRLTAALDLVRSAPLGGVGRRFAWAGPVREAIVAHVVDAADSLACLRARTDDWAAVDRAAEQGLRVVPASERLHRWRMRAAHATGDLDRVHELFETACELVADPAVGVEPDDTLQPETVQLLEALVAHRPTGESIAPASSGSAAVDHAAPGEVHRLAPDRPLPITEDLPEVAATRPPHALIA